MLGAEHHFKRQQQRAAWALLHTAALDLFFHDATVSTDFTNEPAGDARARKQLSDHAFSPPQLAAPMIARAAAGCRRLPP